MFAGEAVYSQDDTPNMLFLVHSGLYRAQVELSGDRGARHARDYRPKENFGACELLCPIGGRSCTVIVVNGGVLWGVPKRVVDTKLKIAPPLRVPGLIDFVCTIKLFGSIAFTRGGRERLTQLCRGVELLELKPDEPVCEQGDAARTIYVVHKGSVYTRQSGTDFSLTMRVQESFGESALFADDELRTRQAAIYAGRGGASILCWDVSKIETLVGFELQAASTQLFNRKMLESARCAGRLLVEGLETGAVDALAAAMVERVTPPLGVLCEEGAYDDALRMVKSGSAVVRRAAKTADIAELRRGDCVGESALLPPEVLPNGKRSRRKTSIVAQGGTPLVTLALSESSLLDAAMQNNRLHAWRNVVIETIASRHTAGIDWIVMDRVNEAGGHAPSLLGLERKEAKGKGEKAAPTSGGLGASGTAGRAVAKPRGSGVHPTAGDESRRAATAAGPAAAASSSRRVVPRPSGAKKAVRRMSKALSEGLAQFAASGVTGTGGGAPSAAAGAAATQERSRQQTPPPPLRGPGGKLRRMSQALFGGSAGQLVSGAANAGAGGPPDALDNPEGGLYKA
jgi:CRP-like cAMP-binding protein